MLHLVGKVIILDERHLVDKRHMLHILVIHLGGGDTFTLISEDMQSGIHGMAVQQRHQFRLQFPVEHSLSRSATQYFPSVIGQDIAVIVGQPELFGQGHDAVGGSSRSEHHFHSAPLGFHERLKVAGCHLLFGIGECAVQVEHNHPVGYRSVVLFSHNHDAKIRFYFGKAAIGQRKSQKDAVSQVLLTVIVCSPMRE